MKNKLNIRPLKPILLVLTFFLTHSFFGQQQNSFIKKTQFGGGIGLNFGNGYTDISISPSVIHNINPILAIGLSLQGGYISSKNYYETYTYGGSFIGLINPIPQIQLSAELEQLRVNTNYENNLGNSSNNYWNTALYLGAGYRSNNVTIGVRYDVLHDNNKSIYTEAFMPFVRFYF
jgi:hypothetical protein